MGSPPAVAVRGPTNALRQGPCRGARCSGNARNRPRSRRPRHGEQAWNAGVRAVAGQGQNPPPPPPPEPPPLNPPPPEPDTFDEPDELGEEDMDRPAAEYIAPRLRVNA